MVSDSLDPNELNDLQLALDYPTPREEGTTLLVIPDFILDVIKIFARRYAAGTLPVDFPSDEDVEVAARAMARVRGASWDTMLSVAQNVARGDARAALQAVADTRRTEGE